METDEQTKRNKAIDRLCRIAICLILVEYFVIFFLIRPFNAVCALCIAGGIDMILLFMLLFGKYKGYGFGFTFSRKQGLIRRLLSRTMIPGKYGFWSLLAISLNLGIFYKIITYVIIAFALNFSESVASFLGIIISSVNWFAKNVLQADVDPTDYFPFNFSYGIRDGIAVLLITVVALFFTLWFYPIRKRFKRNNAPKIIISGISPFSAREQLFMQSNIIPLVSMLNTVEESDDCKMLILMSDTWENRKYERPVVKMTEDAKPVTLGEYTDTFTSGKRTAKEWARLEEDVRKIIKEAAQKLYDTPEKQGYKGKDWYENHLEICFTKPADYNHFSDCYKKLTKAMDNQKIDDTKYYVYFNLSPGTAVVSSVMTLVGVDADRNIFYYNQGDKSGTKIEEIDKSMVPIENLLSQALENSY